MKEFDKFARLHCGINSMTLHDYRADIRNYVSPTIIEERQMNVAAMDVFSRLMMERIIFLGAPIYDDVANIIQAQLLFLESADVDKDIMLYINSPGGSVSAGLGIYDTMQLVNPDVATTCTGMAASMGAVLLTAGAAGKRSALPHSRVMIHQPPRLRLLLARLQRPRRNSTISSLCTQVLHMRRLRRTQSVTSGSQPQRLRSMALSTTFLLRESNNIQ